MCCEHLKETLGAQGKSDCFSNSTTAAENGKKFSLENPDRKTICRIKIDGCLANSAKVIKCDYLFAICKNDKKEVSKYYLVELKGTDVVHAVKQIISTFESINEHIKAPAANYRGFLISSAVPRATEQRFRRLQDDCFKKKKFLITKKTNQCIEKV
jgi:hypothetical protein